MNDSRLAARYAKALFRLVKEQGRLEEVKQDLNRLMDLLQASPEFTWLLESPVIISSEKARIVEKMLSSAIEPVTLDFLRLLIRHRREPNLASTCRMFRELYKADQGIMEANVESAVAADPSFIGDLKKQMEKSSKRKIEMTTEINESLIGGFILTLEDQQLDASVLSKLNRIRQELRESKT